MNPIAWSNDDFLDLGGATPLERCLSEMRSAGYAGAEMGHKFPRQPAPLKAVLAAHGLRLISGWHSTYFAQNDAGAEMEAARAHLALLRAGGSDVFIAAECTDRVYPLADAPLGWNGDRPELSEAGWTKMARGLGALAAECAAAGLKLAYHHHMGTVIQAEAELERLLAAVPGLHLLLDPGHLAFAGIDPLAVLGRHGARIAHVHLKNVRPAVAARARAEKWPFRRAVVEGVFTIPGDREGSVDFPAIFERLAARGYAGWLVVEAEEDPAKAEPLAKAKRARNYVKTHTGA